MKQRSNISWFYPKGYAAKLLVVFQQLPRLDETTSGELARRTDSHLRGIPKADDYDPTDDVTKSFEEAYRVIRERIANGGPGWTPK